MKTESLLKKGLKFKTQKENGTAIETIAKRNKISAPLVYKSINLASSPPEVHQLIETGKITETAVISLIHKQKKSGKTLKSLIDDYITQNQKKKRGFGLDKDASLTTKKMIQAFLKKTKNSSGENAKILREFAELLAEKAPIEELLALADKE